jgi:hypothetical protein
LPGLSGIEGMDSENSLITQARREPIPAKEKIRRGINK